MKNTKKRVGFLLVLLGVLLVGGFLWEQGQSIDSGSWEQLADASNFYVRTDYEGRTSLGYSAHWWQQPEVLAAGFYIFRREGTRVIGEDLESHSQVMFNATARSNEEAEASLLLLPEKEKQPDALPSL